MAQNIGNISLNLGVNTSGFKKQMNGIGKLAQGMTGTFTKLGGVVAAALSVAAVTKFAKACLDLGSDLAEVQNVVDVTFGEMSGAVNKWAKEAMTSYGLSEKVAKDYMGQLGAMSKAFGNSTEEAYKQASALAGLTGDVASFYNLTTDEAFTKLKAVYTGETEALKSLGVVMTQTALDEYAMQKGFGKTTDKMSEQEKVALRLAFVQDRLASASGDFARTSDGWANQTRMLSLRFDALKASIGQGLIVALLPAIRMLNQLVAWLQVAADEFSNFMQAIFGVTGGSSGTSSMVESLATGRGVLASNMCDDAYSAKSIKKSLAGFDQLNILSSDSSGGGAGGSGDVGGGGGLGGSIGSSGSVEPGITAGAAAAEKLKTFLGEIKVKLVEIANITGLTGLWNDFLTGAEYARYGIEKLFTLFSSAVERNSLSIELFKESIFNAFTNVSQNITGIWGNMWLLLTSTFGKWIAEQRMRIDEFLYNAVSIFTRTGTLIYNVIRHIFEDVNAWWKEKGAPVYVGILEAIGDIWKWLLDLYNIVIFPVINKVLSECEKLWRNTLRPLWQNLLGAISDLGEMLLALWDKHLKPIVNWVIKTFGPRIKEVFLHVVSILSSAFSSIGNIFNGLVTIIRSGWQFLTGVLTGDWEKAWDAIVNHFNGVWQVIKNSFGLFINPLIGYFEYFINSIIGGLNWLVKQINKISFDVPDWVPGIGGKKMGFNVKQVSEVSLPRLATGGYVAANTPQLAIVGDNKREGEIIAPESKIAEAVAKGFAMVMSKLTQGGGTGNKQPIYLTIKLGENEFWRGFVDYHNSVVKCTGESPLMI